MRSFFQKAESYIFQPTRKSKLHEIPFYVDKLLRPLKTQKRFCILRMKFSSTFKSWNMPYLRETKKCSKLLLPLLE